MSGRRGKACLLVTNVFPPAMGGSSQVYAALAASAGGEIVVLTSRRDHETGLERPDWRSADRRADYPVHRLNCIRPFLRTAYPGSRFFYRLHEAATAFKLAAAVLYLGLRYRARAVCIADDETVGWVAVLTKYLLGCRTLIYCHGDDLQGAGEMVAPRSRWFGLADKIVAANQYSVTLLKSRFGVPADKIVLIQNGVDLAAFYPGPALASLVQQHGLGGRRVLLTVTRLVPRKGVDKVLEALPAVASRFPDLFYLIVGDGPQREALQVISQNLGVANLVKFIGRVEHGETRDFYNAAEIVLLPNRAEAGESDGLPLVFLEANACAKPVIGGEAGGTAEIVSDGENGVIVDGRDIAAIETAICGLLGDANYRNGMGQTGLAMAQRWGWGARAKSFMATCRSRQ